MLRRTKFVLMIVGVMTTLGCTMQAEQENIPQSDSTIVTRSIQKDEVEEVIPDTNQMMADRYDIIEEEIEDKIYLGEFTLTFYCGCRSCNGKWYGYPAKNGEPLKEGYTVAANPNAIPLNTWIEIDGFGERKVCDTGNPKYIKGNTLDVYIEDHDKCYELGRIKNVKVYKLPDKE